MKTMFFILSFFCLFTFDTNAQIKYGVEAGISVPVSPNTNNIIVNKQSPGHESIFNANSVGNGITFVYEQDRP